MKPKVGVYVCHCGINIASTVDVEAVTEFARQLPNVVVARNYQYMCSDPGQALIKQDIEELGLDRVVVAACSPRMHEPTFRAVVQEAGINPYFFEQANIREQCSWVHEEGADTTEKAMRLVAAAVAKAALYRPLEEREVGVIPAALVIGGGIAGLEAALDIAEAGYRVYLVERKDHLGGHMARLNRTFPTLESAAELLSQAISQVQEHPNIEVMTTSEVVEVEGYVGNFAIKVKVGQVGNLSELEVGAIVVATGYEPFDPRLKPEFAYGIYDNVITSLEFERLSSPSGSTGGKIEVNGQQPKDVVFIKCVGSRDKNLGNEYCSRVCCMYTAKQAHLVKEQIPDANVTIFYIDVRAFGKGFEEFYDRVRMEGVRYRRGNASEIYRKGERLAVRAEDTLLSETLEVEADLVVLAVGMVPRHDVKDVASLLKLSRSPDGFFLEAHPKLRPIDTTTDGVFLAGTCQGPKDIADTVVQAKAAASSALIPLSRGRVKVESIVSVVNEEICSGCGICEGLCAYGALSLHPWKGVMTVNEVLCKGCGACAAACPSGAMTLSHFTHDQILAQLETLVM
ncbi:MAG: CoB--CoM heterodisulfide reductase iron-sulfur subunit A family protein [Anaerolineales bacterium]|nr:MAG: CoB--CoM heterodisulfide reductase iron-sulfur subunit A family protein [Anaerolineales bacterium]